MTGERPVSFVDRQPRSTLGEYSQTFGEFAPAALAGPGGVIRKTAMAVIPAASSETAGQIARATGHEEYEPWARLGGAVLGGGLAAGGRSSTVKKTASGAPSSDGFPAIQNAPTRFMKIYNPPPKPQRPFDADYPKRPAHDEAGKLTEDIDGDPLLAQDVAGRQTLGGNDIGFSPKKFQEVSKKLTNVETVPRKDIGGSSGQTVPGPNKKDVHAIRLADDLNESRQDRVLGHEFGHAVHMKTGVEPINDPVMRAELERNYHTLATGSENSKKFTLPFDRGYRDPQKSDNELIAEAYFAAFKNPNYMKTVAPVTYATLRKWIKSNPELAKLIQLNSLAATAAAGLGMTGQSNEAQAGELPNSLPPKAFDLAKGQAKIADALVKHNLSPQPSKAGRFKASHRRCLLLKPVGNLLPMVAQDDEPPL